MKKLDHTTTHPLISIGYQMCVVDMAMNLVNTAEVSDEFIIGLLDRGIALWLVAQRYSFTIPSIKMSKKMLLAREKMLNKLYDDSVEAVKKEEDNRLFKSLREVAGRKR